MREPPLPVLQRDQSKHKEEKTLLEWWGDPWGCGQEKLASRAGEGVGFSLLVKSEASSWEKGSSLVPNESFLLQGKSWMSFCRPASAPKTARCVRRLAGVLPQERKSP